MGRAPCCEKMGLKKGPWTTEEDQILISYIHKYGHTNWRALPKLAGLLRCGKSCRLRWINYLKPDIKRGNFSREEEDAIIQLHEMLGNRWSAIAAKLPGRTDNEIKNVWHTHLKKKLKQRSETNYIQQYVTPQRSVSNSDFDSDSNSNSAKQSECMSRFHAPAMSPQPSSSTDTSLNTEETNNIDVIKSEHIDTLDNIPIINDNFWSESELFKYSSSSSDELQQAELLFSSADMVNGDDGMDFWYNLFVKSGGIEELL